MPARLDLLHETLWLCEPARLRMAVQRVLSYAGCPTAREVAEARRAELRAADELPGLALLAGGNDHPAELHLAAGKQLRAVKGKVGVVPVHGPVEQRMSPELLKAGGTSTEFVGRALDALLADGSVGAVVLHVDSPGGGSYGVEELADKIYSSRGQKPIYAMADSVMASAAYWIGTAADMVVATPGGDVGSVGVYTAHVDQSQALADQGVKVSVIKAGEFKAEGNPFEPLSEEARANLQEQVSYTYGRFVGGLARNRATTREDVRGNYGRGRVLNPEQALKAGMIDRVLTFEQLMARLMGQGGGGSARAASAQVLRLRQENRRRHAAALLHLKAGGR